MTTEPGVQVEASEDEVRVLHVINQLWKSGAETSLREILTHARDPRLRHALVVLSGRNDLDAVQQAGIATYVPRHMNRSRIMQIWQVISAIRRFRPHLVHTTLYEADLAGGLAGLMTGTPVIRSMVNAGSRDAANASPLRRLKYGGAELLDRVVMQHAVTACHAISKAVALEAVERFELDPVTVHVVPRGRDLVRLGAPSPERRWRVRQSLNIPADAKVVLNVAREEPQKGQLFLMSAFNILLQEYQDAQLLIAGRRGRSSRELDARVQELGIGASVHRLGLREDIGDLLCAADVFVFPSRWEGLGGAVLEAMALGVPIVASDVPALREVLDDGKCGLLVPPEDSNALASAILAALRDPHGADERAATARKRFNQEYGLEQCVDHMERLYLEVSAAIHSSAS